MRCLVSLALALLALEAALALAPAPAPALTLPAQAVCPELSSSEEDACVVSCNSDENCPQGTKCCTRSPCSRSCVVPLIAPVQKAGRCPWVQAPLTPTPCLESTECSRDDQCAGNRKCCLSACAMRCLEPEAGERPTPSRDGTLATATATVAAEGLGRDYVSGEQREGKLRDSSERDSKTWSSPV
ncbi:whey acidic protein-like [Lontra canadensis]|uniref:whey acidic protein-like n=1 Tax=Lontra canadensis TaxID=76717 RepID=UPI0013F3169F|nr:whey acidic protein-like [Lontra canadensis]